MDRTRSVHRGSFIVVEEVDVIMVDDDVDESVVSQPEWNESQLNYLADAA